MAVRLLLHIQQAKHYKTRGFHGGEDLYGVFLFGLFAAGIHTVSQQET
jgi:hypothetical protein